MFCEQCQRIFEGSRYRRGPPKSKYFYQNGILHSDLGSLVKSAEQHCQFCFYIYSRVDQRQSSFQAVTYHGKDFKDGYLRLSIDIENGTQATTTLRYILLKVPGKFSFDRYLRNARDTQTRNTGSEQALAIATNWLNKCVKSHRLCRNTQNSNWHPSRLLDVGIRHNDRIYLRSSSETLLEGPYVALSHCWGSVPMKLKLNTISMSALKQGFLIQELPRLFQDVVSVAHKLSIRYLWIDSLCIQQDSRQDWEKEAAQMAHVYKNSYCTISATQAANSNESLFSERVAEHAIVKSKWTDFQNNDYVVLREDFAGRDPSNVKDAPLHQRAWVVQERILSPRLLQFGKNQLLWECRTQTSCETFPSGISPRHQRLLGLINSENKAGLERSDQTERWITMVEQYSRCQLTIVDDKLVAIGGLAKTLSSGFEGDYIAGIWIKHAADLLSWYDSKFGEELGKPLPRLNDDLVPSWSWISHDGGVLFTRVSSPFTRVRKYCSFEHKEDNFVRIKDIYLRLSVKLFPIRLVQKYQNDYGLYFEAFYKDYPVRTGNLWLEAEALVYFDTDAEMTIWEGFFVPLGIAKIHRAGDIVGLLASKTIYQGRSCYKRAGHLTSYLAIDEEKINETEWKLRRIQTRKLKYHSKPSIDPRHFLGFGNAEEIDIELI